MNLDIFDMGTAEPDVELLPGNPSECPGGFEQNRENQDNLQCENCDYYLTCFPEEKLSSNG